MVNTCEHGINWDQTCHLCGRIGSGIGTGMHVPMPSYTIWQKGVGDAILELTQLLISAQSRENEKDQEIKQLRQRVIELEAEQVKVHPT